MYINIISPYNADCVLCEVGTEAWTTNDFSMNIPLIMEEVQEIGYHTIFHRNTTADNLNISPQEVLVNNMNNRDNNKTNVPEVLHPVDIFNLSVSGKDML